MTDSKRFLFRSAASVIDQMLLSGLGFVIGLVLIRFATKETYGLYSQLFGIGILTTSFLEALIGSSLTTQAARIEGTQRAKLLARVFRVQLSAGASLALFCGVGVMSLVPEGTVEAPIIHIAIAFGLYVLTLSIREYVRTAYFIDSDAVTVAKMDALYVTVMMVSGGILVSVGHATVVHVLGLLALSNALAVSPFLSTVVWPSAKHTEVITSLTTQNVMPSSGRSENSTQSLLLSDMKSDIKTLWSMSRWALVGALVAWTVNNGYLYFAGGYLGVAVLADLNASRLFLIPLPLVVMAWIRVARPTMGQFVVAKAWSKLNLFMLKSTGVMVSFAALYMSALMLGFPLLSAHILGEKYSHVADLLLLWGVYFMVNGARNVGTTALISFGVFRVLFWQGLVSAAILALVCFVVIPKYSVHGALGAMIFVEFFELMINWFFLLPKAKQGQFVTV